MLLLIMIVGLLASIVGAVSGIGGGVIIKPVLDAVTPLSASVVGFLSTCAVFSMSLIAVLKCIKEKREFEKNTILLGIGAVLGGFAGTQMFQVINTILDNNTLIKTIQNGVLFCILVAILFYINGKNKRQFCIENKMIILIIGFSLGMISAFLGIGGGPINVAVLSLFFAMDIKRASVNSIILILFSQASKITTLVGTGEIPEEMQISMLLCIIPAALVGGAIGSAINKKISKEKLKAVYNTIMLFVILTCLWNVIEII